MKRKCFTEQEIAILSQNPYTAKVSTSSIKFTPAFKLLFWQEYCSGTQPTAIFRKYNYDPGILGHHRIGRIQYVVKNAALAGEPLYAGVKAVNLPSPLFPQNDHLLKQLQKLMEEVEYLKQENAFLKKTASLRGIKLQEAES